MIVSSPPRQLVEMREVKPCYLPLFDMTIQQDPYEPDRWWFAPSKARCTGFDGLSGWLDRDVGGTELSGSPRILFRTNAGLAT